MRYWLKRSDRLLLIIVVSFALAALSFPYLKGFLDRFLLRPSFEQVNGRKIGTKRSKLEIVVPRIELAEEFRIDLNEASVADLQKLKGIGPVLAKRIVAWRKERGELSSLPDLDRIEGIGPSLLEELRDKVEF